ncbi:BirA family biotin operon repressor/biotin-[acetyl-CoA-carboxylase] ligase [Elusimicrobium posterum]|uniref:biotin--[acetyl-CoA-carboxylase] ligase n=1 Tax=Elusimicrobium posterum TaxID=3116653 RepID=UPI003C75FEF8
MQKILEFDELNSTNTYVKEHASTLEDKTVVLANRQTSGRGRFERKWESDAGGLYFTIVLKPAKTDYLANLTQLMCLAVCEVINQKSGSRRAYIKWPNDVHAQQQKICGILSEAVLKDGQFYALALGAGVNVGQKTLASVSQPAVSLKMLGVNTDNKEILTSILDKFFELYDNVIENGFTVIREQYKNHFPALGRVITVGAGEKIEGVAKDVDDAGRLVLQDFEGKEHKVLTGEIL